MLIGLTGKAGSGKDTVGDYFVTEHGGFKIAFAGPLKEACKLLFRLSDAQLHDRHEKEVVDERWGKSPRQLFQEVGTDLLRTHIDKEIFTKSTRYGILAALETHSLVVVTDCRFENETALIRELGGVVWHLRRGGGGGDEHVSEQVLPVHSSDHLVDNDGSVDELLVVVDALFRSI
jgi:hypothetical protein